MKLDEIYGRKLNADETDRLLEVIEEELSEREMVLMFKSYGLKGEQKQTVEDIATFYEVSPNTIKKVINEAIKKLHHPKRMNYILDK